MYLHIADGNQILNMRQWVSMRYESNGAVAIIFPTYSYVFRVDNTSTDNPIDASLVIYMIDQGRDFVVEEKDFKEIYVREANQS